jgi:hypothetical protein
MHTRVQIRADPDRPEPSSAAALEHEHNHCKGRPITMPMIIVLAVIAIVALIVLTLIVHVLFSPWLLVAAIAILAWIKFRPRHSRQ